MHEIELLAPARDLDTGLAAINCGADAVYLGADHFGARENAGNPLDDIEKLTAYAHRYWAKIYITVNTILNNEEISQAAALIQTLYGIGVDGVIIQDIGLLECNLPPIPLFASTQMHNHTPERVAFLEMVGIKRVILARELSLEQIRQIRMRTSLELESFVHGSLCVSYSGQCYLSYAFGGRSGNRGQCAQPCRKLYRLEDANGAVIHNSSHLLSLRDLNLSTHLKDLIDAGVSSFKIEGRLKDKAYVMNVIGYYRKKLNEIISGNPLRTASSGKTWLGFQPDLMKTFNRGYTTYFLNGRSDAITAWDTPKSLGEPLGKVASITKRSFSLDSQVEIHAGDGLCYLNADHVLDGTTVNQVHSGTIFPAKMEGLVMGSQIYRNHDQEFLSILEHSRPERKIAVDINLTYSTRGLALTFEDEDGIRSCANIEGNWERAEKAGSALATIEKQLRKLGDSEFTCRQFVFQREEIPFIPVATLNTLRRDAVKALVEERNARRPRMKGGIQVNNTPFPAKELNFNGNVFNSYAARFYRRHGVERIEPAVESGLELRGRRVMTTKYCLKFELGGCPKNKNLSSRLAEPLTLVNEQNHRLALSFNCAQCEMEVFFQEGPE